MSLISVVMPVYNEESNLRVMFERLRALQETSAEQYRYIFVDDGSTDNSLKIIRDLAERHKEVKYISFSRNFGHEVATTAGLDHCSGDAVVIIDADLQDPPEVIPSLVDKWREGYQVVYGQRRSRKGETPLKKFTSWLFYRIIRYLSDVNIPIDTGDFRLIDKCVLKQIRRCREQNRFIRGLVAWTGFRQTGLPYDRDERYAGQTKYSLVRLIILALDAVIGFSVLPLRLSTLLGHLVCGFSIIMSAKIFVEKLFWNIPVPGYALMVTGMFFLGGVQLLILGLIGEYIGRIYRQLQQRPMYIIAEKSETLQKEYEG